MSEEFHVGDVIQLPFDGEWIIAVLYKEAEEQSWGFLFHGYYRDTVESPVSGLLTSSQLTEARLLHPSLSLAAALRLAVEERLKAETQFEAADDAFRKAFGAVASEVKARFTKKEPTT